MSKKTLKTLKQNADYPAISIILKTDKSFPDKKLNQLRIKNAIKEIKEKLGEDQAIPYVQKIDRLLESIDLVHVEKGLGIYVSNDIEEIINFPIEIEEVTQIGNYFLTGPIEETIERERDYIVLALSKNHTRLFVGHNDNVNEIEKNNFPMKFENEFQYDKANQHSQYNSEESTINQSRIESFFRDVDSNLILILEEYNLPVLLLGVEKHISTFKQISKNADKIQLEIKGNYDDYSPDQIAKLVSPELSKNL